MIRRITLWNTFPCNRLQQKRDIRFEITSKRDVSLKSPGKYSREDDVLILAVTVKHHATVGTARIRTGKVLARILIGNNDVIHIVHRI